MTTAASIPHTDDTDPGPVPAVEAEQDWIFTFGHGQRAYAHRMYAHRAGPGVGPPKGRGISLMDRYVVLRGTAENTRTRMFDVFGDAWSHQYADRAEAGIDQFELTELVLTVDAEVAW